MSRDNESPIDPMYDPEPDPPFDRLSEVERQLKKARPRPVALDGFELERQALVTPANSKVERSPLRRRRHRVVTLLAGSWVCGAMVGAVVVFLLMQPPASTSTSQATTHVQRVTPPVLAGGPSVAPPKTAPQLAALADGNSTELEAAVLALSSPNGTSTYPRGGQRLRAGMHLPQFANQMPGLLTLIEGNSADELTVPPGHSPEQTPSAAPSPTVTRGRLLQDLLGESSEVVL